MASVQCLDAEQKQFVDAVSRMKGGEKHALLAAAGSGKTTAVIAAASAVDTCVLLAHTKASCNVIKGRCRKLGSKVRTVHSIAHELNPSVQEVSYDKMLTDATVIIKDRVKDPYTLEVFTGMTTIIVDEFQDITEEQYRLVEAIQDVTKCALVVVGDTMQDIFRFRGAQPFLAKMMQDSEVSRTVLVRNYRSCYAIVAAANRLAQDVDTSVQMHAVRGECGVTDMRGFSRYRQALGHVMGIVSACLSAGKRLLLCCAQLNGKHQLLPEIYNNIQMLHPHCRLFCTGRTDNVSLDMELCDITIGTVHGVKGGGWHTVIYIDTGSFATDEDDVNMQRRNRLYTAWTRAEHTLHHLCLYNWCGMPCTLDSCITSSDVMLWGNYGTVSNTVLHKPSGSIYATPRKSYVPGDDYLAERVDVNTCTAHVLTQSLVSASQPPEQPSQADVHVLHVLRQAIMMCVLPGSCVPYKANQIVTFLEQPWIAPKLPLGVHPDPTAFVHIHTEMCNSDSACAYIGCVKKVLASGREGCGASNEYIQQLLDMVIIYFDGLSEQQKFMFRKNVFTHQACVRCYGMYGERTMYGWQRAPLNTATLHTAISEAVVQLARFPADITDACRFRCAILHWDTFELYNQWQLSQESKHVCINACNGIQTQRWTDIDPCHALRVSLAVNSLCDTMSGRAREFHMNLIQNQHKLYRDCDIYIRKMVCMLKFDIEQLLPDIKDNQGAQSGNCITQLDKPIQANSLHVPCCIVVFSYDLRMPIAHGYLAACRTGHGAFAIWDVAKRQVHIHEITETGENQYRSMQADQ